MYFKELHYFTIQMILLARKEIEATDTGWKERRMGVVDAEAPTQTALILYPTIQSLHQQYKHIDNNDNKAHHHYYLPLSYPIP